jgi:hypothetical protein
MSTVVPDPTTKAARPANQKPVTQAGITYSEALTVWLQETRLMSEAIFRLYGDYQREGRIQFAQRSWPKKVKSDQLREFTISPVQLAQRMDVLLKNLWSGRFVFLETLWEEYLQELVKELRHQDTTIFEPFCERDFMADVVRSVLIDRVASVEEIKDEVAARFAAGITRQPWADQWKQLGRLKIGLGDKDRELPWFNELDVYFEMRNCVIHRQGRVSPLLQQKSQYFQEKGIDVIEIWPPHLDHYRHQFIKCLLHMESKIAARFGLGKPQASSA